MKYILFIPLLCFCLIIKAQSSKDSVKLSTTQEYLTIIIEQAGSTCKVYLSKDSSKYEKKTFNDVEQFNLSEPMKILQKLNKEGWAVQNSNISMVGDSYPYRLYLYYLLSRKK